MVSMVVQRSESLSVAQSLATSAELFQQELQIFDLYRFGKCVTKTRIVIPLKQRGFEMETLSGDDGWKNW